MRRTHACRLVLKRGFGLAAAQPLRPCQQAPILLIVCQNGQLPIQRITKRRGVLQMPANLEAHPAKLLTATRIRPPIIADFAGELLAAVPFQSQGQAFGWACVKRALFQRSASKRYVIFTTRILRSTHGIARRTLQGIL